MHVRGITIPIEILGVMAKLSPSKIEVDAPDPQGFPTADVLVSDEFNLAFIDDDVSADLEVAMTARRELIQGRPTPEGILTRMAGTLFERLVQQIESSPDPAALALGLHLLTLGEDTCKRIRDGLVAITHQSRLDHKRHDFSIGKHGDGGLTFHSNLVNSAAAREFLRAHCEMRKYATRSPRWMGVSVSPDCDLQSAVVLEFPWVQSADMQQVTRGMSAGQPAQNLAQHVRDAQPKKLGRNDPCTCGSGRKYKKCCL